MDKAFDAVLLGEAMMMLMADRPGPLELADAFLKRTAGAETNVAIGLARLGLRVGWSSRLGEDSMGRYLLAAMQREGIDCSRVARDPSRPTGFLFKGRVDDGSDPPVEYHRKGSAASAMGPQDLDPGWLASARHLHATGVFAALSPSTLALQEQCMKAMRDAGRTVSFDPNLRPSLWPSEERMRSTIDGLARLAHWVLPGLEEGRFLTGRERPEDVADYYLERGARAVVVKLGSKGAYFHGAGQGTASCAGHVPAFPVPAVVDTVGAGDGFAVGVISALLEGRDLQAAARRGAWIGARAVQVRGDTEGLPSRAELDSAGL
ncbi:2-dehydro-3-deoxygluconokinase [Noviherbaspirillum humi]|uniref:2-dehydro-3-deoxygluconokinase n=1 Tax=Noviherbaspirillum humi TaxID=1688639 RepID=A0A239JQ76_9BURK|nr:sugar kinase [Noviherbaspirillum humi]SNT07965.1 2-dehydro-3-deoxygluconokinase [Noviherbaspirillum humi]